MTDAAYCYCDCGPAPLLYDKVWRRARKSHRCYECGSEIPPGEEYEDLTAVWERADGLQRIRTCADCVELRDAMDTMDCFCWCHGSLLDDVQNQFVEADFPPALRFNLLRVVAEHRRRRRDRELTREARERCERKKTSESS